MPFDLDNLNPATRFHYNDDEWVELRICSGEDLTRIHKQTRKKKKEYRHGILYRWEDVDEDLEMDLMNDFAITAWDLVTPSGESIPCTKENKNLMMRNSVEFAGFVTSCLQKLNEKFAGLMEEQEKN